jgi:hypothetical protein
MIAIASFQSEGNGRVQAVQLSPASGNQVNRCDPAGWSCLSPAVGETDVVATRTGRIVVMVRMLKHRLQSQIARLKALLWRGHSLRRRPALVTLVPLQVSYRILRN